MAGRQARRHPEEAEGPTPDWQQFIGPGRRPGPVKPAASDKAGERSDGFYVRCHMCGRAFNVGSRHTVPMAGLEVQCPKCTQWHRVTFSVELQYALQTEPIDKP